MVLLNNFWYKNVRDTNKEFLKREFEINIGEEMEINPVEGNIINVAQRPLEELQQSVEPESLPIPGNIPTRSIFRGGDGEQPKIENCVIRIFYSYIFFQKKLSFSILKKIIL